MLDSAIATEVIKALLSEEIEALVEYPPLYSRTAYTPRRTIHTCIVNGAIKPEGDEAVPAKGMLQMCADTISVAKQLRAAIDGPAILVWRALEIEDARVYARLCFEAL